MGLCVFAETLPAVAPAGRHRRAVRCSKNASSYKRMGAGVTSICCSGRGAANDLCVSRVSAAQICIRVMSRSRRPRFSRLARLVRVMDGGKLWGWARLACYITTDIRAHTSYRIGLSYGCVFRVDMHTFQSFGCARDGRCWSAKQQHNFKFHQKSTSESVVGVGVSISAFQAGVPGSSPGRRIFFVFV